MAETDTVRLPDPERPVDPVDRRLALRAEGLLATFNRAEVITAGDVHVATRLGSLAEESDPEVRLAVALASRAVRNGSVCLDLAAVGDEQSDTDEVLPWPDPVAWVSKVQASPLMAAGVLHWEHDLLYFDRYLRQETQLCVDLLDRMGVAAPALPVDLDQAAARLFPGTSYDEQRVAAVRAVSSWTTVLTGGPGTGKTTTVAGMIALLAREERDGRPLRVALAAPTGKAAARLHAAVREELAHDRFLTEERDLLSAVPASTLHRLLGPRPDNATRFRHHRGNRLPHDVIVVDETSMVSLTMMARLVEAVRPDARLVLVGDHNQLASVDAGAVLADLVAGLPDTLVAELLTNHRSEADIVELGAAIREGAVDRAVELLRTESSEIGFDETPDGMLSGALRTLVTDAALALRRAARAGDVDAALEALEQHRLLCAHRDGPFGVSHWNRQVERWISEATVAEGSDDPLRETWYAGRPVLVTANDPTLGLHNGDTGVVVRDGEGHLRVVFQTATGHRSFSPGRLDALETMHAMTIHKAQGSQASVVTVLLPDSESRLLTRELLYTAVTRARHRVNVVGSEQVVRDALDRRVRRASGLRPRLASSSPARPATIRGSTPRAATP